MYAIVDERILVEEEETLEKLGYKVIKCPKTPLVNPAISSHPDIQLFKIDQKTFIVHNSMDVEFKNKLIAMNYELIESAASLSCDYPKDIFLNAYQTKEYFIHNIDFTDKNLLAHMKNKKLISVKQGYTKCSILPISDKALITNDPSIASTLEPLGFDILKLPYGDILLPGYSYGFIGGCGGLSPKGELLLFGELKSYAYHREIMDFLQKYDVKPISLSRGKLKDRGSIFFI
ncbi:DUF6873 family GME fold protein [Alloiococcus sp. CFN-8]|uniref:DUF6873 family GME fold protein n=1 Tax=Alloiococcus sp. CFN-8 TaxID=3416081 RepID=UPI003CEA14B3